MSGMPQGSILEPLLFRQIMALMLKADETQIYLARLSNDYFGHKLTTALHYFTLQWLHIAHQCK